MIEEPARAVKEGAERPLDITAIDLVSRLKVTEVDGEVETLVEKRSHPCRLETLEADMMIIRSGDYSSDMGEEKAIYIHNSQPLTLNNTHMPAYGHLRSSVQTIDADILRQTKQRHEAQNAMTDNVRMTTCSRVITIH